ncbi:hypothetical protein Pst134EA_024225 [Puccinia striiformis f. sp. tritici]|uniref:Uncharacterized protein n=2 Tax=Puccinia striiformis TaxID=27350 RepID=A0A0L0VZ62_9BASI|nr:hypothetical protein Pst134EA_024225 [Puccinia striiformis f. sp. tritici]KAH9444650.1 hypothetical protein Pst134EB_024908 [Puccinia striiformis f. sp. tritici]KAH9453348.1 hypothetical protein Pst134EA_024225 [Puccinia striiformis f. sp. tritici]KAI9606686.1 hypothetical protein H4Q26_006223 [Puccinia striiformis f. sp. tritici PST-130]KNF04584.1 hypothetical protein PSTG_02495 [Puccinia striiformis f. sp. tritici PST-78]
MYRLGSPTLLVCITIYVVIISRMIQLVVNRSTGLSSIGSGHAKFSFNSHIMKETFDHTKLHHLQDEALRNHTHLEIRGSGVPEKPRIFPASPSASTFPCHILTEACQSCKPGHSVVDRLIVKKMKIIMAQEQGAKCHCMKDGDGKK